MAKKLTLWTIADARGNLFECFVRRTRGGAVEAFCDNGDEDEGGLPPDNWRDWTRKGYRAVRLIATPALARSPK